MKKSENYFLVVSTAACVVSTATGAVVSTAAGAGAVVSAAAGVGSAALLHATTVTAIAKTKRSFFICLRFVYEINGYRFIPEMGKGNPAPKKIFLKLVLGYYLLF
jgi:hypothetical protein